jgi:hypothetical protein
MKNWEKPQKLVDFCSTVEQDFITTDEMLSDVLGRIIGKLDELEARIVALEPKKK